MKWQRVKDDGKFGGYLWVTKVSLGWLACVVVDASTETVDGCQWGLEWRSSVTFIPDPEHKSEWDFVVDEANV